MRRQSPIHLIVHTPNGDPGRAALAGQVAQLHADAVLSRVRQLDCPATQKMQLLDAVIMDARGNGENKVLSH